MILIAGGTGTLGRELVSRLTSSGRPVRVLTRDPAHAAGLDADVCTGDVCELPSLTAAVDGCDTVISAMHGFLGGRGRGPEAVDNLGNANLIHAAANAGVGHYILLSALDARPDNPMALHRAKYAAEQTLYASGLAYTVLRPSSYIETWIGVIGMKLATGGPAMVFGHGRNPINFVSILDVASLVEQAIGDPALRGETIDVPGSDNLSMIQIAQLLGATKTRHVPLGALRFLGTVAAPFAPAFGRQAASAVVMDTTDMTADATDVQARFPQVNWHRATDVISARRASTADG